VQFNFVEKLHENWTECSLAQHRFPIRSVSFFVSSVCLLVHVTMMDKNKAVICCLLVTSATMLTENEKGKCKMCSKKWYLKRNISCDGCLSFIHFRRLSALRWCHHGVCRWTEETVGFAEWTAQFCVKDDWKGQFWGLRYCLSKLRSLLSFSFRYDVTQ
jgi:hypothetical protein